jgi:adenosylmethionine-8-amino-7-oxononanoate aminotransferase
VRLPPGTSREDVVAAHRAHVWPPYTSADVHLTREPLVIVAAEGAWLEDADGRRLLDGNASWWTSTLGHRHPRIRAAVRAQLDALDHVSMGDSTNVAAALLAKELVAVAPPGLVRVHFSDDGSTAVEVAIKLAQQFWAQNSRPERTRFVSLGGAFHGDTLGAVSLGGVDAFRKTYGPLLFDVLRAPDPGDDDAGWARLVEAVEAELIRDADRIAAVVVEPLVQGAAGMRIWAPALLRRLREATVRADTLLVCDEVFTGYGRTGRMWASEHAGITPDLLCTAKGFTAGTLPMAATLATERLWQGFSGSSSRALMHGHTFCGHPLGAAVAREVLAIFRDEDVLGGVARKQTLITQGFTRIAALPGVRRTRSLGMIGAADLGEGGYGGRAGWRVYDEALARGAYLRPLGDTVYVTPPLTIPDDELTQLLDILHDAVRAAATG